MNRPHQPTKIIIFAYSFPVLVLFKKAEQQGVLIKRIFFQGRPKEIMSREERNQKERTIMKKTASRRERKKKKKKGNKTRTAQNKQCNTLFFLVHCLN